MRLALISSLVLALVGCRKPAHDTGHESTAATTAPTAPATAPTPGPADAGAAAPVTTAVIVPLKKDVPAKVAGGLSLTLVTTLEANVTDKTGASRNQMTCQLKATKDGATRDLSLTRLAPDPGPVVEAFGAKLSLVMADAHHNTPTAVVRIEP